MANTDDQSKVDAAIQTLIEHFDSVQIFVSRHEPGEHDGTIFVQKGAGSFFTRYGQVKEFLIKTEEYMRCESRKHYNADEESEA